MAQNTEERKRRMFSKKFPPKNSFRLICFCFKVDLRHMCEVEGTNVVPLGIDLSEFYMSVEWDILEVPAVR